VISDIHLGQGGGISVLTRPRPLAALLAALDSYDRLVLLGDTVELKEVHAERSLPIARPVLEAIAERLGPDRRLVLVPGNHDHLLVRHWARAAGGALGREGTVPLDASPWLKQVASWLSATQVEVHYPGVWLADGIWATHGHYLNHYLRPVSTYGLRQLRRAGPTTPAALEYVAAHPKPPHLRDGLLPDRWIDRHLPSALAPAVSSLLDRQVRRHVLPAMLALVSALGVEADHVVFGHVHRRGPRERDEERFWTGAGPGPLLVNTGSWRYEPLLVRRGDARSPYWPGGAVSIGEDGVPRSVGLLDAVSERDLVAVG